MQFGFWVDDVAATRKAMEAAGGRYWMGEPVEGGGFYEVKYRDPDGVVVDITANGWVGAVKDAPAPGRKSLLRRAGNKKNPRRAPLTRD